MRRSRQNWPIPMVATSSNQDGKPAKWQLDLLGTASDAELADCFGRTVTAVRVMRNRWEGGSPRSPHWPERAISPRLSSFMSARIGQGRHEGAHPSACLPASLLGR
jgi:hypothetical protein